MRKNPASLTYFLCINRILPVMLFLIAFNWLKADTPVAAGNQSGTWTKAGSPYILAGNITIPAGQTLMMEPGCIILIPYSATITVNGTLTANGTAVDSIQFRPRVQGSIVYGGRLLFNTGSINSSISYAILDSLGYASSFNYAVRATGILSVANSSIRNAAGYGFYIERSNTTISQCNFGSQNSSYYSLYLNSDTISPVIKNCTFNGSDNAKTIYGNPATFSNVSNNSNTILYATGSVMQNSIWPKQRINSYYKIGSATVSAGKTLTIQPGCKVLMPYGGDFTINGTLIANGILSDSIYFIGGKQGTSYNYGGTFNFNASSQSSTFSYVSLDSLGYNSYPITADGAFSISNSNIKNSGRYAISISRNSVSVNQCYFSAQNSSYYSVYISNDTISPVIQNCTFSGNDIAKTISGSSGNFSNISNNTNAIIEISGAVKQNATWHKLGLNSYYKASGVSINSGKTLTIEPGTKVLIPLGYDFTVNGTLIAEGTQSDSIYFFGKYQSGTNYGGGINLTSSSTGSSMKYVSLDSLGMPSPYHTYSLRATGPLSFVNSSLRNSGYYAFYIERSSVTVDQCSFSSQNPSYSLVYMTSDTISPTVQNSTFGGSDIARTISGTPNTNFSNNTNAIIEISGAVKQNTTWHKLGLNSYYKARSVTVNSGKVLTIEPGSKVQIPAGYDFTVNGTLIAEGTQSDSVYFFGKYQSGINYGGGIYLTSSSVGSSMKYVSLDSLGYSSPYFNYPLRAAGPLSFVNSSLRNSGYYAFYIERSSVTVDQCSFSSQNPSYSLVYMTSDTISPTVQNSTFGGSDIARTISGTPNTNFSNNTNAIIEISGAVKQNTTWHKLGLNSYYKARSVTVNSGKVLTIEPGSKVQIPAGYDFTVNGTLIAEGTQSDSVYFFGKYQSGINYGGGIYLTSSSVGSSMKYVSLDSLGYSSPYFNYPLRAAGPLSFVNSSLRNSGYYAFYIERSSVTVDQCSFSSQNPSYSLVYMTSDTISPTVQNSTFGGSDIARTISGTPNTNFSNNTNAIIEISGAVKQNTTWHKLGLNSYYKARSVTVNSGKVLTIEPGSKVQIPAGYDFTVNGTLIAEGTQSDSVYFFGKYQSGINYGGGIYLTSSSVGSSMKYVSLDSLGYSSPYFNYPLRAAGPLSFVNSSLMNSGYFGFYISGASPTVSSTKIINNPYGVYVTSGKPVFSNCIISNNTNYGIYNESGAVADTIDARNCYWGDTSGPLHASLNPSGKGNKVSDKVKFIPWIQQLTKVDQTISLAAITDKYVEDTVRLNATATSGLPVSYSISTIPSSGVALLSGNTITFPGDTGRVIVSVTQAGNDFYNPAAFQSVFKVIKHNQVITFNSLAAKTFGDSAFAVRATASSNLPVQLSIVSGSATLSQDSIISLTGAGTVTIKATQAGNQLYFPATPVQQSFTVYPKLPDFAVQEVASTATSIAPKDTVALSWKIANIGRVASAVDLAERIYIQSPAGANRTLIKQIAYTDSSLLDTGRVILRSALVALPAQLIIGDSGVFVVEIVPGATVQEAPGATANNTGVQITPWAVKKVLALSLSAPQLTEGSSGISVSISRSGSVAAPLTPTISFKQPQRYNYPTSISIPAGHASVSFTLAVPDDSLLQGTIKDTLEVAATGFAGAKDTLTVLDNDNAMLSFVNLPAIATEGDTVQFAITTNQPPAAPLTVYLNSTARFPLPASVVIPKDSLSAKLVVRLVQNSTPELDAAVSLTAGAAGHNAATATILVKDDDLPNLELILQTKTVSEGAGQYATQATLRRTASSNALVFTANLSASLPNILLLPATVSLAANEAQKTFTIGVIDNANVDSLRRVIITASVYVASCGCSAPPASAGYVSDTLNVSDNDGPALLLTTVQQTFPEGIANAGVLRIARNTYTTDSLLAQLSSSDLTEATVPATAVIPAGQTFVEVPITTVSDTLADGNQTVYLNAMATGFAQGTAYIVVTDLNKPDLQIPAVTVSSSSVQAKTIFNYQLSIKNTGAATAPAGVLIRGYLSQDNIIDNTDSLISEDIITSPIAVGQTVQVLNAVMAPDRPGQYKLLFKVNPAQAITELITTNNTSQPLPFTIAPDYTATAMVAPTYIIRGTLVTITGLATRSNGILVDNKQVEVFILTNGLRRKILATTDSAGHYNAQFIPLAAEAGHYAVGAGFPGLVDTITQDAFDILGVTINNGTIPQFRATLGDTLTGTLTVQNLSNKAITNFTLVPISLPNGASIRFDTIAMLTGNANANIHYRFTGTALSPGNNFEIATLQAVAIEGSIQPTNVFYYCQTPNALLTADIANIDITVSQSTGQRIVQFRLVNKGMGTSGNVSINLPQASWLTSVTPRILPPLASGDTALVILKFLATSDIPLGYPVNGNIGISTQNGSAFTIPFTFEKVATTTGAVKVTVTDQFTYYSAGSPKVKGALVKIKNYYTNALYAQGYSDSTGVFTATGVPEGTHRISVEKDRHLPYNDVVTINPGDTIRSTAFINYQAITFSWNVVPTTIQDQYTIKLTGQFETNIPIPVVTVDMPAIMPQLTGNETYSFNVTLTNHGLITAEKVALNLPTTDPEYEFITNYIAADLSAQQSIQIPVLMRLRSTPNFGIGNHSNSIAGISQFLGMQAPQYNAMSNQSLNCQDFVGIVYTYRCNLMTGLWERNGVLFTFSGRACGSSNGGGEITDADIALYNWLVAYLQSLGNAIHGILPPCVFNCTHDNTPGGPYTYPEFTHEKKSCVKCLVDVAEALVTCSPIKINKKIKALYCLYKAWNSNGGVGDYVLCIPGLLPKPISCLKKILGAMKTCYNTHATSPDNSSNNSASATTQNVSNYSPSSAFDEIANNFQIVIDAYQARESWAKEYFGDLLYSDAWDDLSPLLEPNIENLDSIIPTVQLAIINSMSGYDIQQSALQIFFSRWNTSIYARSINILQPNIQYPNIINWNLVKSYSDSMIIASNLSMSKGFESVYDMYENEYDSLNQLLNQQQAVCASVSVQFSQQLTMTREAFDGTLKIFNGHPSEAMDSISVNILITDSGGVPANGLFQIQTTSLDSLANVSGTGSINAQGTGTVKFLFIPTIAAAPQSPNVYNFGGSVRYWDPYVGAITTFPLASVPITVNPSPNLSLHYFMERNILGDDALTSPAIEPSIPAELAVMVQNEGYGDARNLSISSAQPKIVDNEKGLAIEFNLIGSNFQGQPVNFGLNDILFGDIPALQARVGQWYFTSSLLGKFVSYQAEVVHDNSYGNPNLSLVNSVQLHELTKSIREYGSKDDGINDFLVNDNFDIANQPDKIYFSQGSRTADVQLAASGSFSSAVLPPSFSNTLTVTASGLGWNYIKLPDPGNRLYDLVSVTRIDGQAIPLNNAWLTFVTLPASGSPVYENKFHLVDSFRSAAPVAYTVVWKPRNFDVPKVDSILNVPATGICYSGTKNTGCIQ